jgi:colanic acid biosynthesis glycosyl transferase WcaI
MNSSKKNLRRKIIFVNRYFFPDQSATSQMLSDLGFGLASRGLTIHIICSRQGYNDAQAKLLRRESIDGVAVHRIWTTRFGRDHLLGRAIDYASFYVSCAVRLTRLLCRGDIVVAMTDPPLISIVAMAAARLKGAHLVNWLQDIFPEVATRLGANPLPWWANSVIRRLRNASLRAARLNVVLGERMRELLELVRIANSKIRIIENWANVTSTPPRSAAESKLRARLGLSEKFVVGYSGNLGRAHEFATLLNAASLMRDREDVVFLMIGGGAGMRLLQNAVSERGLHNFAFIPHQPRASLSDSLAAADVHWVSLLPALEGVIVPSKFYGILAAGRPVVFVGDPDGELARVIHASQVGVVVSVGAASELALQLRLLADNEGRRNTMGRCGYELFGDKYTAQRALDRWIEILDGPLRE